jgi:hypothetical protein
MGSNPVNLALRFLLELAALTIFALWGWNQGENWLKYVYAISLPVACASFWGIFAVPKDPGRSGKTVVAIPGLLRLVFEVSFFSFATWALYDLQYDIYSRVFGALALGHYVFSYDRILWLIKNKE